MRDEKGVAIIMALVVLFVLSAMLAVFLPLAASETLMSRNHLSSKRAFYLADAGVEWAYDRLADDYDWSKQSGGYGPVQAPGGSFSVVIVVGASDPWMASLQSTGTTVGGATWIVLATVKRRCYNSQGQHPLPEMPCKVGTPVKPPIKKQTTITTWRNG